MEVELGPSRCCCFDYNEWWPGDYSQQLWVSDIKISFTKTHSFVPLWVFVDIFGPKAKDWVLFVLVMDRIEFALMMMKGDDEW